MKKRITIVGRGLDPGKHLTVAAIRALRQADRVIGIETELEAWALLENEFDLPRITDVARLYEDGGKDLDNYHRFVDFIITNMESVQHLCLLVAGHPRLGVTFIELLKKASGSDFEIQVIEGISSFDTMINDIGLDPLERGTVMLDANRLLLFHYHLEPALNHFIYHICSVGTSKTHFSDASIENRLDLLRDYLLQFYPGSKRMFLCRASTSADQSGEMIPFQLSDMKEITPRITFATTLYIPAEKPTQLDEQFLTLLR